MNDKTIEEPMYLELPGTETLRKQLALKLEEYHLRVVGKGQPWEYQHPEQAHMLHYDFRDACYKHDILKAVLEAKEPVSAWNLSLELKKRYKDHFAPDQFSNACEVITMYVTGKSDKPLLRPGTGLPKAP